MKATLLLPLLLILSIPLANGAIWVGADYPVGASDASTASVCEVTVVHPSATAAVSAYYFTFMVNFNGGNLSCINVGLLKEGSPVGYLCSQLYAVSGTYGTTSVPTGAALERSVISLDVSMASLQAASSFVMFNFSGSYALSAGVVYAVSVEEVNETTCDTSNGPRLSIDTAGSYGGNAGYYASGGWSAFSSQDDEAVFEVYVDGGDAVTYMGNDIIYGDTDVTISGSVNATGAITTGNITAGDVTASGGVSVNVGGVTAEFNNTIINATGAITAGDVSAGAVTAGDVTANGAVTFAGDIAVNGTFDNATLTYATSSAVSGDANVYFLIAFIGLAVLLTFYNKVPLLNFLVGVVGISFIMLTIAKTDLPFWPYSSVLLALTSLLCMLSGGFKMRNS